MKALRLQYKLPGCNSGPEKSMGFRHKGKAMKEFNALQDKIEEIEKEVKEKEKQIHEILGVIIPPPPPKLVEKPPISRLPPPPRSPPIYRISAQSLDSGLTYISMDEPPKTTNGPKTKKKKSKSKQNESFKRRKSMQSVDSGHSYTIRMDGSVEATHESKSKKSKPKRSRSPESTKPESVSYLNIDDSGRTIVCLDESITASPEQKPKKKKSKPKQNGRKRTSRTQIVAVQ